MFVNVKCKHEFYSNFTSLTKVQSIANWRLSPGLRYAIILMMSSLPVVMSVHLPSNPWEPIISKPVPAYTFQEIAADFCSGASQDFLILEDYSSLWLDVTT